MISISWKRNLAVIWFAEFTSIVGFASVFPILPLYVQELGIHDPAAVRFWSGLIMSAQAVTMAVMAPIWGSLSDRYGRKLMVERAMFGGALIFGVMGFARSPLHLVLLRALQGVLTGTVTAATTLVASSAPRERSGWALGILQMGIYSGASAGPYLGGVIFDTHGAQAVFWITSGLLLVGGVLVALFVQESMNPSPRSAGKNDWRALRESAKAVFASRPLLSAFGIRMMMRTASRLVGPILTLLAQELAPAARAATAAGTIQGVSAATGALGAILLGWVSDRTGPRRVLIACGVASAALYVPQFFVTGVGQLTCLQAGTGFAMGGILATLSATLAALAPDGKQGTVYGLDASIVSAANAVAPTLGVSLAVAAGDRATFLGAAVLFAVASLITARILPRKSLTAPS